MSRWLQAKIGPTLDDSKPDYQDFIKHLANYLKAKVIPEGDVRYIEDKEYSDNENYIYKKDIVEKEQANKAYNYALSVGIYLREYLDTEEGKKDLENAVKQLPEYRDTYADYYDVYHDKVYTRPSETFKYFCKLWYDRVDKNNL